MISTFDRVGHTIESKMILSKIYKCFKFLIKKFMIYKSVYLYRFTKSAHFGLFNGWHAIDLMM